MGRMLEGKAVIVSGAGRGIGKEIALAMAAAGACVVVNDLGSEPDGSGADVSAAQSVVAEITASGGSAVANTRSVASEEGAASIADDAIEAFGRIDCVVNNAGIVRDRIFYRMSADEFDKVIGVHLRGSFLLSRAAAPHFKEQRSGSFVHMTSSTGLIGNVGQANYAAAKLGIVALSKSIALDMRRFNVRSNCVSPSGWTRLAATIPDDSEENRALIERVRSKMAPEKNAPMAVFLASDQSADVSGQIFAIRGNEVFLFSQPRPVRSLHRDTGWTPEAIASDLVPAMRASFTPLDVIQDVYSWDPM